MMVGISAASSYATSVSPVLSDGVETTDGVVRMKQPDGFVLCDDCMTSTLVPAQRFILPKNNKW